MFIKNSLIILTFVTILPASLFSMEEKSKPLPGSIRKKLILLGLNTYNEGGYHFIVGRDDEMVKDKKNYLLQGVMYPESDTVLGNIKESKYGTLGKMEWLEAKETYVPGMVQTYKIFVNPLKDKVNIVSEALLQSIEDLSILQKLIAKFKILEDTDKMQKGFPALVIYPTVGKANVEKLRDVLSILFPDSKVTAYETPLLYAHAVECAKSISDTQGEYFEKTQEDNKQYFDKDLVYYKEDCDPKQDANKKSPYALGSSPIKKYKRYALYGTGLLALAGLELYSLKNRSLSLPGTSAFFGSWYKEISLGLASLAFAGSTVAWYEALKNGSTYWALSNYASKLKFD